jgi:hypothetical protein
MTVPALRLVAGNVSLAQDGGDLVLSHVGRGHRLPIIPCTGLG